MTDGIRISRKGSRPLAGAVDEGEAPKGSAVKASAASVDLLDQGWARSLMQLAKVVGTAPAPAAKDVERVLGPARSDRQTRILATLGPACSDVDTLAGMIEAGMDVARINFSHLRDEPTARKLVNNLKAAMTQAGRPIQILGDLQGPKIRTGVLEKPMTLKTGGQVTLCADGKEKTGQLPIAPSTLLKDLKPGDPVFIDDGKIELSVTVGQEGSVQAEVIRGGEVNSRKGLNLPRTRLTERVPTAEDLKSIEIMRAVGIDLVAVSFVEDAADLNRVRAKFDYPVRLISKIERPQALENLAEIFAASDGLMVARGDLAVEVGDAAVPLAQNMIHTLGHRLSTVTGTATEMLDSMKESGRPTRAEASDVYRSVAEGADFVMTSAETAMGKDPVGVMRAMAEIVSTAEAMLKAYAAIEPSLGWNTAP